jgi:pseudaminic acid biosynthesis-associated methylase
MKETEQFWRGSFGDQYAERNKGKAMVAANAALFGKILARTAGVHSVIELGANIGMNLDALRFLLPESELTGVEINQTAFDKLVLQPSVSSAIFASILTWYPQRKWDLSLAKGILIHIAPDDLPIAYAALYNASSKYILLAEYYSPTPVEVQYRGHAGRLWKRDFAGDMLEKYPDLNLVDYGFQYHRDANWPADDLTWTLLEKTK